LTGGQQTRADLWVLPLNERKPFPVLNSQFSEMDGAFSPDGRWIAYVSDETETEQVYVWSFPATGGKWPISAGGGIQSRWRRDGRELFFESLDGKLMAVEVKAGAAGFEAGPPKLLFEMPALFADSRLRYDAGSGGQRFLILTSVEESAATSLTVVLNWAAELKQ